jgi:hypothetical protein
MNYHFWLIKVILTSNVLKNQKVKFRTHRINLLLSLYHVFTSRNTEIRSGKFSSAIYMGRPVDSTRRKNLKMDCSASCGISLTKKKLVAPLVSFTLSSFLAIFPTKRNYFNENRKNPRFSLTPYHPNFFFIFPYKRDFPLHVEALIVVLFVGWWRFGEKVWRTLPLTLPLPLLT